MISAARGIGGQPQPNDRDSLAKSHHGCCGEPGNASTRADMNLLAVHTVCGLHEHLGGPSRSVPGLCGALKSCGVDAQIVSVQLRGEGLTCTPFNVRTVLVPGRRYPALRQVISLGFPSVLRTQLAATRDVVLHDHGLWLLPNQQAISVARRRQVPAVVSPRGMLSKWALDENRLLKQAAWLAFQRRNLCRASVIHATSTSEAADIRSLIDTPISIVPNGVHMPADAVESCRRSGMPRTALFLSRLHKVKGLELLIEAWARVRPDGWRLVVCGAGSPDYTGRLKRLVQDSGILDLVSFEGNVAGKAKEKLFAGADLFVLPTLSENFGLAVAEALSWGIPVITTRGAPWHELEEYRCGWWTAIGVQPVAEALRAATSMPSEALAAMGRRGQELIRRKYSWAAVARQMVEVYHWTVSGGHVPPSMDNEFNIGTAAASSSRVR